MKLTPAIKGMITKAINKTKAKYSESSYQGFSVDESRITRDVLERYMPREQAKHAARRYLASNG